MAAWSLVNYTGDGATTQFAIPFKFLKADHIFVYVADVLQTQGTHFTVDTANSRVNFTTAPANAAAIKVQRVTERDEDLRTVIFADGAGITQDDLNNANLHNLFCIQELIDQLAGSVGIDPVFDLTTKADVDGGNIGNNAGAFRTALDVYSQAEVDAKVSDGACRVVSADYTALSTDETIIVEDPASGAAAVTITVPTAAANGKRYTVYRGSGVGTVTVQDAAANVLVAMTGATACYVWQYSTGLPGYIRISAELGS